MITCAAVRIQLLRFFQSELYFFSHHELTVMSHSLEHGYTASTLPSMSLFSRRQKRCAHIATVSRLCAAYSLSYTFRMNRPFGRRFDCALTLPSARLYLSTKLLFIECVAIVFIRSTAGPESRCMISENI